VFCWQIFLEAGEEREEEFPGCGCMISLVGGYFRRHDATRPLPWNSSAIDRTMIWFVTLAIFFNWICDFRKVITPRGSQLCASVGIGHVVSLFSALPQRRFFLVP